MYGFFLNKLDRRNNLIRYESDHSPQKKIQSVKTQKMGI